MAYGTNYKQPCEKFAVDILNDAACKYDAYTFFVKPEIVRAGMMKALNTTLELKCYSSLQSFQLSGVDLPNMFETAIQQTQINVQDAVTAKLQQSNN